MDEGEENAPLSNRERRCLQDLMHLSKPGRAAHLIQAGGSWQARGPDQGEEGELEGRCHQGKAVRNLVRRGLLQRNGEKAWINPEILELVRLLTNV